MKDRPPGTKDDGIGLKPSRKPPPRLERVTVFELSRWKFGAGEGIRTLDPNLGKSAAVNIFIRQSSDLWAG